MSALLTIDQLITPLTPLQVKEKIYTILAELNVSTTNWKPGAVVRLMIAAVSVILAAFSLMISQIARSAFLSMSQGAWLTLVARHVYGVERRAATFATGPYTLWNNGGGSYDPDIGELIVKNPITGKTYTNTERLAAPLVSGQSATIAIRADEAGGSSSTGPGTITELVSKVIGISGSNSNALVGLDEQTDDSLMAECLLKPTALSPNGARGAYVYFAKQTARNDGTPIGIDRVVVSNSSSTGRVSVCVAVPSGAVSGSDLALVSANIATNCLTGCVTLTVTSARTRAFNVSYWAYFDGFELSESDQNRFVIPAIDAWMESLGIGGATITGVAQNMLLRDTLRDIIAASFPVKPLLVIVYDPASDVQLAADERCVRGYVAATRAA